MKKIIAAFCVMSLVFIPLYLYLKNREKKTPVLTTVAKALCICVSLVIAAARLDDTFHLLVFIGMAAGAVGDVTLGLRFNVGMAFFFTGHIVYTAAFLSAGGYSWYSLAALVALAVAVSPLMHKHFPFSKQNIPYYLYALMIANMVSIALFLPLTAGGGWLIAAGAALFAVSDCFVALSLKVALTRFQDGFALYLYFIGQFLIACGAGAMNI